ncbi:hypothetical protein [Catellatospora tritici]|uniref:hypothetical protein n=1 Tax=Catellatospora tritici TaxID=2851566 RepID=UPI001C2CE0D8|nr:hypothetical protein [Catellatospora tritici]MBV1853849.1 hypothetical protein [Catellatospora tritici]
MARRYRARVTAIALAALVLLAIPVGYALVEAQERAGWATHHGCGDGPTDPGIRPDNHPQIFQYPFGATRSCRELDREAHPFGAVEASIYLLLDTDRGPVAVRVDYQNLYWGWQWHAGAWELPADEVADLVSPVELRRLREAIAARGGIHPEVWVLHYGDG